MNAGSCCTRTAHGPVIVPGTCLRQSVIHPRFDAAFGLTTDGGKFRNDQITRALQHSLFAKREWFNLGEIAEMLEHISNFKDISASHLVGKFFEAILPIIRGRSEVAR